MVCRLFFFFYLATMHTIKTVTLSLGFVASLTVVGSVNQREQNKVLLECPLPLSAHTAPLKW